MHTNKTVATNEYGVEGATSKSKCDANTSVAIIATPKIDEKMAEPDNSDESAESDESDDDDVSVLSGIDAEVTAASLAIPMDAEERVEFDLEEMSVPSVTAEDQDFLDNYDTGPTEIQWTDDSPPAMEEDLVQYSVQDAMEGVQSLQVANAPTTGSNGGGSA